MESLYLIYFQYPESNRTDFIVAVTDEEAKQTAEALYLEEVQKGAYKYRIFKLGPELEI